MPAPKKYNDELCERATRLAVETLQRVHSILTRAIRHAPGP